MGTGMGGALGMQGGMDDRVWSDEEKHEWMAVHGGTPTHVVTFGPLYQVEVCVPPWEQADRTIARSAVDWGRHMSWVFDDNPPGGVRVVAAHHEGNTHQVHVAVSPRPRMAAVDEAPLPGVRRPASRRASLARREAEAGA